MFERTRIFFRTTLLGGFIVVLPAVILIFAFRWFFGLVSRAIEPLTNLVLDMMPTPDRYDRITATLIVLAVIVAGCFFIGLFVRTRIGRWIYERFENSLLSKTPGYRMIKETVNQLFSRKASAFSSVALVRLFENETRATAFITDRHDDGTVTVFVPTGPNPTSGFIYHINQQYVEPVDVPVEDAMRSVISCGAGSGMLLRRRKPAASDQPKSSR